MRKKVRQNEFCNMSCDNNDDELKLTKEYKYLLSQIRPLIDQLDKSRDAQLCLLWLSKLEQCANWERGYRNKILSELCKQVKTNSLKPPFNASPPSGSLRKVVCGVNDWKESDCNITEYSEIDSSEEEISSSSVHSLSSKKKVQKRQSQLIPWKEEYGLFSKSKCSGKFGKELLDHSECFAIQKAYHERAQSDQMVIERYQEIIKSLVSQQLKVDISPRRLKKLHSTYESKMAELVHSLKKVQEENAMLRQKVETINLDQNDLKSQNENLKKQVCEFENVKVSMETKYKRAEEEKLVALTDLIGKLNESEKKLKESEKRVRSLERKQEENYHIIKNEHQAEALEKEKKYFAEISNLERLLEERQSEIICLKEQMSNKSTHYENEIHRLKQGFSENSNLEKDKKKIKTLKCKAKKLEKIQEHMAILFQTQLQQILAKKDFYIATLEMQLKMNNSEAGGSDLGSDLHHILNQKVSNLEAQYRKLLEDSERQSLKRRQLDLQKIHTLEKQLLQFGGVTDDPESSLNHLKTRSLTSVTALEDEVRVGKTF